MIVIHLMALKVAWKRLEAKPYAFTEQGVAMLFSVLKSKRAVQVNIEIMRAFRGWIQTYNIH